MPGFPATNLIEDVGIRPDVFHDVFTIDNLRQAGVPYISAFTGALFEPDCPVVFPSSRLNAAAAMIGCPTLA